MKQRIGYVSLVVRDYDEASAFYTKALGFDFIARRDGPGYIDQSGAVISRTLGLARS